MDNRFETGETLKHELTEKEIKIECLRCVVVIDSIRDPLKLAKEFYEWITDNQND